MATGPVIAVVAALAAAASFGAAGVLQHQATQHAPRRQPLRPRLLVDLIGMAAFRSGVVLGAIGFALQVVALSFGPLTLVQPLLVTGTLFYIGIAYAMHRRWPDAQLMLWALAAMAGLSGFLVAARPTGGHLTFHAAAALPLGLALVAMVTVCLMVASRTSSELRALPLAVATAVCYGVTAGLVRSLEISAALDRDPSLLFQQWQLYAIVIVGPAGFLLNQNAFQSGLLGAGATATITVGDPIVAIGVGIAWLGESIAAGPLPIAGEVVSLAVMAGGVLMLTHRSQYIAEVLRSSGHLRTEGA